MPNQPIRNIQLKNGSKYPVSPAYRAPIIDGNNEYGPMDYVISPESATATGIFRMTISAGGSKLEENAFTIYKFTDDILTQTEISNIHARFSATNLTWLGTTPIIDVDDPFTGTTNDLAGLFATSGGVVLDGALTGLPGNAGAVMAIQIGIGVVSIPEALSTEVTATQTGKIEDDGDEITVDIEVGIGGSIDQSEQRQTLPAGTYWVVPMSDSTVSNMGVSAEVSICDYMLDRRYVGDTSIVINNYFVTAQLLMGIAVDLTKFPSLEKKLTTGAIRGERLVAWLFKEGSPAIAQSTAVMYNQRNSGTAGWEFFDGSRLVYSASNHTLTYTAGT